MFNFNTKLLYFFGSNVVVNNIYCVNTVNKNTFTLYLSTDKGHDRYLYKNKKFETDKNTFEEVLLDMGLKNFLSSDKKKFSKERNGTFLFKIEDITGYKIIFDKKSQMNFGHQYHLYFTDNYIDSTDDSIIKIQNENNSNYTEYKKNYRLFIDRFKDINQESLLIEYICDLNDEIQKNFYSVNSFSSDYYIKSFKIGDNIIIDDEKNFNKKNLESIKKGDNKKKIEIMLNKYNKYSLNSIKLSPDLAKIYKLKNTNDLINKINSKIPKSKKELTYGDIQKIITNTLRYDGISLNNDLTGNLTSSFHITIKKDSKNHFTEPKKCTITFISNEFELEDGYKKPIEIIFDDKVNEGTKVKEYIFKTYNLDDTNCEIKNKDGAKVTDNLTFSDGYQRNIIITKEVAGITKKKDDDSVIINIEICSDKPDEFKLKDDVVKNKQIVLKKGSCKITNLINSLKNNDYDGIEKDGIIAGIFLDTNPKNNILESTEDLIAGQYKILLSWQENGFVEKLVKKPGKKNITLTIVPKDATKYKLNEISKSISISVSENISYNDFVNEVKKIITDGKFEVYINDNKVENGNIDINKQIIIKLLDDCDKLEKNGKKEEDDDNNNNNNNNNNTADSNTQTKQKKYCEGKYVKK